MSVNPGALFLLVVGVVALIVGLRGTQKNAAQLLTGVSVSAAGVTPVKGTPKSSPASGLSPTGAAGGGGGGGGGGSW